MLIWASDLTSEPSTAANITVGNHKSAETLRVFRFSLMLWCENIVCIYALVKWNDLASVFVTTNTAGDFPTTLLKDIKLFHTYKYWSPVLNSGHWLGTFSLWLHHHLLRLPQWRSAHKRFVEMTVWYTEYEQMWTCHWFVLMSTCCPGDGADGKSTAAG